MHQLTYWLTIAFSRYHMYNTDRTPVRASEKSLLYVCSALAIRGMQLTSPNAWGNNFRGRAYAYSDLLVPYDVMSSFSTLR